MEDPYAGQTDREEILEMIASFAQRADRRDWEGLVGCFAQMVDRDYSSLTGSGPDRLPARKLVVEDWAPVLGALDATQHLIGLPVVSSDGDSAAATAHFQAQHVLANTDGGDRWTLGGRYDFELRRETGGWRISGVTMTALWSEGNQRVMSRAAGSSGLREDDHGH
jgi:SnoaL-like domain